MNDQFSFGNLDDVESGSGFDILPVGVYPLRAIELEMRDTKDGGGSYLSVQFEVTEGAHQGRRVFQNFNLVNRNQQAVEIALRDIKAWIEACGLPARGALTMDVIQSLEGKNFLGKLGIERDKSGQYEDRNKVAKFLAPDGAKPTTTGPTTTGQAPAPAAGKKPWEA